MELEENSLVPIVLTFVQTLPRDVLAIICQGLSDGRRYSTTALAPKTKT